MAGTSALMQLEGWNWQDMALRPEVALHVDMPSLRAQPANPFDADSLVDMRSTVSARLRQLDEVFATASAYAKARAADPKGSALDTRWEAMLPVLRGERPVFVQADERGQIRQALALARRHGLKLVIVGGADAESMSAELRERDVPVVIAGLNRLPLRRDDDVDTIFRLPAALARAGVRFAIARNAADSANERNLAFEAGQAVAHGLEAEEALKAVTLYPARILGVESQLGSLEVGKLANFIVADGSPLDIRSRIERVFVQGREIELRDRHTDLRDKYQQRYRR
jgi:imidazolonepropionase-like amidohydrolase